ncbi:MAG: hypothetical protein ACFHX7_10300 [Pseudomonadota bacterium]
MRALLISAEEQKIEEVDIASQDAIASLVGYDTLEMDEVDGDRLYFDEECFIRGTRGRFQIDKLIPVAGKGVIVGVDAAGDLVDTRLTVAALSSRIRFS